MSHRVTVDVIDTAAGPRYRARCGCGEHRIARSPAAIDTWGPEHVVSAFERTTR